MSDLTAQQYEQIIDLSWRVLADPRTDPPWRLVLTEIAGALHATMGALVEIPPPPGRSHVEVWTHPDVSAGSATAPTEQDLRTHPITAHLLTRPHPAPVAISDLMPARRWRRHDIFLTSCHHLGGIHQIFLPLPARRGHLRTVTLNRPDRDFTDSDRAYLAQVRPLLRLMERQSHQLHRWQAALADRPAYTYDHATANTLTGRELAILSLLAETLTATTIAHRLGITTNTVNKHLQNLYRKLGTHDRLGAILRAQDLGLLPAGVPRTADRPPPRRTAAHTASLGGSHTDGDPFPQVTTALPAGSSIAINGPRRIR